MFSDLSFSEIYLSVCAVAVIYSMIKRAVNAPRKRRTMAWLTNDQHIYTIERKQCKYCDNLSNNTRTGTCNDPVCTKKGMKASEAGIATFVRKFS